MSAAVKGALPAARVCEHFEARYDRHRKELLSAGASEDSVSRAWDVMLTGYRAQRDRYLNHPAFDRVLTALDETDPSIVVAARLIGVLCRIENDRVLIQKSDAHDAVLSERKMQEDRDRAIRLLGDLLSLLGPNYHARLFELREQVEQDQWPTWRGDPWAAHYHPSELGTRGGATGAGAWHGLVVREVDARMPSAVKFRNAAIADLLKLALPSETITRQDVQSLLRRKPK